MSWWTGSSPRRSSPGLWRRWPFCGRAACLRARTSRRWPSCGCRCVRRRRSQPDGRSPVGLKVGACAHRPEYGERRGVTGGGAGALRDVVNERRGAPLHRRADPPRHDHGAASGPAPPGGASGVDVARHGRRLAPSHSHGPPEAERSRTQRHARQPRADIATPRTVARWRVAVPVSGSRSPSPKRTRPRGRLERARL